MNPVTLHIIRQQYLHVTVQGTEADGLALQARLSALCQQELMPALEQVLNRYAPPNGHLVIAHLDLDVGSLPLERLEQDFAGSVAQALEKVLQEQPAAGKPTPAFAAEDIQLRTDQEATMEAFVYFLKTGLLPWFFRLPAGRDLEQALLDSWQGTPEAAAPFSAEGALRGVLAAATARERLSRQFSPAFLQAFLHQVSPESRHIMDGILEKLPATDTPPFNLALFNFKLFNKLLWETMLGRLAKGAPSTEADLVSEAWRCLLLPSAAAGPLQTLLERYWPGSTQSSTQKIPAPPTAPAGHRPGREVPETAPGENLQTGLRAALTMQAGIYIDNAGLILLHPFLPRFFEHAGLMAGDEFLKPDRTLCLLHYLATGQSPAPEYELILPKILCHIPLETPVEKEIALTDVEKGKATALLEAVIRHWEVLKSTSPDGLRGTFLVRPGKLSLREDGDWLLQVEPRTYDILLHQLPWGITMIKLPWMERMLWVEWNY